MVIVSRGLVKSGNAIGTRQDMHMKLRKLARSSKSLGRSKATTSNGRLARIQVKLEFSNEADSNSFAVVVYDYVQLNLIKWLTSKHSEKICSSSRPDQNAAVTANAVFPANRDLMSIRQSLLASCRLCHAEGKIRLPRTAPKSSATCSSWK